MKQKPCNSDPKGPPPQVREKSRHSRPTPLPSFPAKAKETPAANAAFVTCHDLKPFQLTIYAGSESVGLLLAQEEKSVGCLFDRFNRFTALALFGVYAVYAGIIEFLSVCETAWKRVSARKSSKLKCAKGKRYTKIKKCFWESWIQNIKTFPKLRLKLLAGGLAPIARSQRSSGGHLGSNGIVAARRVLIEKATTIEPSNPKWQRHDLLVEANHASSNWPSLLLVVCLDIGRY